MQLQDIHENKESAIRVLINSAQTFEAILWEFAKEHPEIMKEWFNSKKDENKDYVKALKISTVVVKNWADYMEVR